jgi:uncharacterized protein (TIGR04255 family)
MARKREHLGNAPIVEAIIDFRVPRPDSITADSFSALEPSIGKKYGQKSEVKLFQGYFGVDNGRLLDPSPTQIDLGWRYQDQHEIAQFRVDGFTFSRIEPYTTWEEVFAEAFRLWKVYCGIAEPTQVTRLAVRYINRMRISGATDLNDYLEASLKLPQPIPQRLREFLTRVRVEDEGTGTSAVIVQALEPSIDASALSILLDIDAFRQVSLPPEDQSLPAAFEQLRKLKNDIFYASITEMTARMYE